MSLHPLCGITYAEFLNSANAAPVRTLSRTSRPEADERAWKGRLPVEEFLAHPVYPVWYVTPDAATQAAYNSPDARRVLFSAAIKRDDFTTRFVSPPPDGTPLTAVPILALECTRCGHVAVLDGNHRLAYLALNSPQASVDLIVLSGSRWPRETPDMAVICACLRPESARTA